MTTTIQGHPSPVFHLEKKVCLVNIDVDGGLTDSSHVTSKAYTSDLTPCFPSPI